MRDRAQVAADPFPLVSLIVVATVAVLVGDMVWGAQKDAIVQCAPNCELGAPLFAHLGVIDVGIAAGLMLVGLTVLVIHHRPQPTGGEDDE